MNPAHSLKKTLAYGALWMLAMRLCIKAIAMISTVILARLLTPADFGLMAMAMSVYALVELLREFGFDAALIQKQDADKNHYDTAWTLQILFSIIASSILVMVSGVAAEYYRDSRLTEILPMLALIILMNGFNNIAVVEFRKSLSYHKEFLYQVLIKFSGFCVTIPLAWYWRSYWALMAGMLSTSLVTLILSYGMQRYRPVLTLHKAHEILAFSKWLLLNNALGYLTQHAQNILLGRLAGSHAVGVVAVANEIATLPTTEIVAAINRAAYPGYAKLADDPQALKDCYLGVMGHIVIIALPSALGIAVLAPYIVPVLLGEQWLEAIPVMQILAIGSAITAMSTNAQYIYLVQGRQRITTRLTAANGLGLMMGLIYWVPDHGILGVAYAFFAVSVVLFPVQQWLLKRSLAVNGRELGAITVRPLIATLIMFVALDRLSKNAYFENSLLIVFGLIIVGIVIYSLSLILMWIMAGRPQSAERHVMHTFKQLF